MNISNIKCKDCGSILAQLRTPIVVQNHSSTSMCGACANKRMLHHFEKKMAALIKQ